MEAGNGRRGFGKSAPLRILVTKVLPADQKGDLAIALAQLDATRACYPRALITVACRRPWTDASAYAAADKTVSEIFPGEKKGSAAARYRRLAACLLGRGYDSLTRAFSEECQRADIVIFCGGGSLGGYGARNLILNALCPVLIARRAGKPIYFSGLSVTWSPVYWQRRLVSYLLNQADRITLREPLSFTNLKKLGVQTDFRQTADWAFLLPGVPRKEADALLASEGILPSRRLRLGMNLRDAKRIGPDREGETGARLYASGISSLMAGAIDEIGADIVIYSMNRTHSTDDLSFAKSVVSTLPDSARRHVHILEGDYTPSELKGMIATSDLFIGTRFHASLFALSTYVPTLALHDQQKVVGLMKMAGLSQWHLRVAGLSEQQAMDRLQRLRQQGARVSAHLQKRIPELKQLAWCNLDPIAELLQEVGDK